MLADELTIGNPDLDSFVPFPEPEPVEPDGITELSEVTIRLRPHHLADLRRSGLSDETILLAEIRSSTYPPNVAKRLNWRGKDSLQAAADLGDCIAFPFLDADGNWLVPGYARYKPDHPRTTPKSDGTTKTNKYESPRGEPNRLYIPPRTRSAITNPTIRLITTEGEKKSLAADQHGFACVGLVGVYGWQKKREGIGAPRELIPDMQGIAWAGREVSIIFDSDIVSNPDVRTAQAHLADTLAANGAEVRSVILPTAADGSKVGLDDYLLTHTPAELQALIDAAEIIAKPEPPARPDKRPVRERQPHGAEAPCLGDSPDNPHRLASSFLKTGCWLRYWRQSFHEWNRAAYRELEDDVLKARLSQHVREEFVRMYKDERRDFEEKGEEGQQPPKVRPVSGQLLGNVLGALRGLVRLDNAIDAPAWMDGRPAAAGPNPRSLLAAPNGLLDLDALAADRTDDVISAPDPDFFTVASVGYKVAVDAPEPKHWLAFLKQLWAKDAESIACLQEWFGYCLTADTSHQKMMWAIGPSRAGKGVIGHVLTKLVGEANVATPSLYDLGNEFGLQPLPGKTLALIGDGRLSNRPDVTMITARLLQIVGEDAIAINRKNRSILNTKLQCRFMICANEFPALCDQAEAIVRRAVILRFIETFAGKEDRKLKARLETELPGILLWAVKGLARLRSKGKFTEPKTAKVLKDELGDLLSPTGKFVRELCVVGVKESVQRDDLFAKWKEWCESEGRTSTGTKEVFGRNLRSVVPILGNSRPRPKDENQPRVWYYTGLRLRTGADGDPYPEKCKADILDHCLDHTPDDSAAAGELPALDLPD